MTHYNARSALSNGDVKDKAALINRLWDSDPVSPIILMVALEKKEKKRKAAAAPAPAPAKEGIPVISVPVISSDDGHVLSVVSENSEPACCPVPVRLFVVFRFCCTCLQLRPAFKGSRTKAAPRALHTRGQSVKNGYLPPGFARNIQDQMQNLPWIMMKVRA